MDINCGDILVLKKKHPCGSAEFCVLRIGSDIKISCRSCGREMIVPRIKLEKAIKQIIRDSTEKIL